MAQKMTGARLRPGTVAAGAHLPRDHRIAAQGRDDSRKGECYEYRDTDFARVAQSFDCFGATVGKPQDFRKAFEATMASELPAVIDVKTEFAGQAAMAWVPG